MTVTITQVSPPSTVLRFQQPNDPLSFLQKMASQDIFTNDEKKLIQNLIDSFDSENAVNFLILFLSDIIYPSLETNDDENFTTRIESIIFEVHSLLRALLPSVIDIEEYINSEIEKNNRELGLLKTAQQVNELVERKDNELCILGDQINANIEECHERLKQRLLQIVQVKELISQELVSQNNAEVEKINALQTELKRLAEEFKNLGSNYKQQQANYQALLKKSHELVRSVRR